MTTPDSVSTDGHDPVLTAGLADLASSGVNLSDPVDDSPADPSPAGAPSTTEATPAPTTDTPAAPSGTTATEDTTADPSAQSSDPAPDPLAGTEPFTYTVNGETRTMAHAYRVPGEGILIEEAAVPQFQLMASRAESLESTNRTLYEQAQQYERLSQWTTTDAAGQTTTLTGREALEAARVDHAQKAAALQTLAQVFQGDPLSYLSADASGNLTWNRDALSHLMTRSELEETKAERVVRQHFASTASQPVAPPQIDVAASAPVIVQHYATELKATALTAEDRTALAGLLPRFVHPATQADVQGNPALTLGQPVVDPQFAGLVQQYQTLRAQATTVAKTAGDASKFNAGQHAGLKKPAAPAPKPAASATPGTPAPKKSNTQLWEEPLSAAMAELGMA